MKTDIHPTYAETHVTCSCGNTFTTRSTKLGDMHIELCNECHPFFTGKQKLVDSGGRGAIPEAIREDRLHQGRRSGRSRRRGGHRRSRVSRRFPTRSREPQPRI